MFVNKIFIFVKIFILYIKNSDNMRKYLISFVVFIFFSAPLLAQEIETKSEVDIDQKRAAIINNAVNMGEIIFGVAFAFQLAFVIIKVRKGLKESSEIVN